MKRLREERDELQQLEIHRNIPVRVYEGDWVQDERVKRARLMIANYCPTDVVELGCGTGDISGPFSEQGLVLGYDISEEVLAKAKERFPKGTWLQGNLERMQPVPCGVLVLSEVLEHLYDPMELVKRWAPKCKYLLISHPLDEQRLMEQGIDLSGGEHLWSFSREDHNAFFDGFQILDSQTFPMGSYTCVMSIGAR